jgi:alkylation response protein AidB-like acyl-CoA dehydrogenase
MGAPRPAKLGPFLTPAMLGEARAPIAALDIARHLVLGAWRLLGGLEAAFAQVVEHVTVRKQFKKTLSEFQTVRFAVADASVALLGLEELAKYTTWRIDSTSSERAAVDAVALRLHTADTATQVLRACHQLLGAVGFCDEHDVSVYDRHLQPLIRLPASAERLALRLVPSVRSGEFETLFS